MKLPDYIRSLDADGKRAYARRAKTTVGYLKQISGGHSTPGPSLARRLVTASNGKVELHEARSDIWQRPSQEMRV